MSSSPQGPKNEKRGGKLVPALCSIAGTLILLGVIAFYLPVSIAHAKGYEVYNVVSGSMEPAIPVGSVIYVETLRPEEVAEGDVIAFHGGDSVIAHRVVKNRVGEGEFITKGDANAENDMNPVAGGLLEVCTSSIGKLYLICLAACGAMLNILAGRLRNR